MKKKIVIIGSGIIGEAAGRGFLAHDMDVTFCDVDEEKIERFKKEGLQAIHLNELKNVGGDIFLISVPTPTIDNEVSLEFLHPALEAIGEVIKDDPGYPVVATRSTVPVGTAERLIAPTLEKYSEKKEGEGFGVASNPEFLREKTAFDDFLKPWVILIGSNDERSKEILGEIYKPFEAPIRHLKVAEAETEKYVHNLFNAAKISFFNEQRMVCEERGLDADAIFDVVAESCEGVWNHQYGLPKMSGYRGACLPKDIKGFIDSAKKDLNMDMKLLRAVEEVNETWKKRYESGENN